MAELFTVLPPSAALAELLRRLPPAGDTETVPTSEALGRVCARDVQAPESLPAFSRSAMDGFAVRAADTYGASENAPAYLRLTGEVRMGTAATLPLLPGEAHRIHTGAMIPPGADAVVMLEETNLHGDEVEVLGAVAEGEDVIAAGEDVAAGDIVAAAGRRLRAPELGALSAVGAATLAVYRRPRIAVLSTGDEVVSVERTPVLGQVRDVNSATVAATISAAGGISVPYGIVRDDEAELLAAASAALAGCDGLVLSAGSSVSARDLTARVVERLGAPGVLVHGIAIKPGKPTVLALCDGKPVIGLPGNPASALVVAWRLVRPLVRALGGETVAAGGLDDVSTLEATLTANVSSRPGREDYVPAVLSRGADGSVYAAPIFGKSNLIFTLVRAGGLVVVPLDLAGLAAGARATVVIA